MNSGYILAVGKHAVFDRGDAFGNIYADKIIVLRECEVIYRSDSGWNNVLGYFRFIKRVIFNIRGSFGDFERTRERIVYNLREAFRRYAWYISYNISVFRRRGIVVRVYSLVELLYLSYIDLAFNNFGFFVIERINP